MHRDLKPENLFLTKDGHVKILDFGLAKLPELAAGAETIEAGLATMAGTVLGTVGYMSPEQVRGDVADHRSDVFSLGTVLYQMFSGRRAFIRPTSVETMNAILKEEPPALPSDAEHAPSGVQRILDHCLEKEPEQRFQSRATWRSRSACFPIDRAALTRGSLLRGQFARFHARAGCVWRPDCRSPLASLLQA